MENAKIIAKVYLVLAAVFAVLSLVGLYQDFGMTKASGGGASILFFLISLVYELLPKAYGKYFVCCFFMLMSVYFGYRAIKLKRK